MFTLRDTQALFGYTGIPPRVCPGWRGQHGVANTAGMTSLGQGWPKTFWYLHWKIHLPPSLHGHSLLGSSPARARSRYFWCQQHKNIPPSSTTAAKQQHYLNHLPICCPLMAPHIDCLCLVTRPALSLAKLHLNEWEMLKGMFEWGLCRKTFQ